MTAFERPAGLVLAGGTSRRMGEADKAFCELAGRPLVAHAIDRLNQQAAPVAISSNRASDAFSTFGAPVLPDPESARFAGPLAGVLAGLAWAGTQARRNYLLTVAVDTPFFPMDLSERLAAAVEHHEGRVAIASSGGREHPVFGLWPVTMANALGCFLREGMDFSVMRFLARHNFVVVDFAASEDSQLDPFFNINTPDDLARAETMTGGIAP